MYGFSTHSMLLVHKNKNFPLSSESRAGKHWVTLSVQKITEDRNAEEAGELQVDWPFLFRLCLGLCESRALAMSWPVQSFRYEAGQGNAAGNRRRVLLVGMFCPQGINASPSERPGCFCLQGAPWSHPSTQQSSP